MALITQRGVDRFTAGTRQRFAAENEDFDRKMRLKQAASGRGFEPEDASVRAVRLERARQQNQDLRREEGSVRGRYQDGKEFQSSQQLFDANDVSILPEAVLARHGRMAPAELVRTERDRVNAGGGPGGWSFDPNTGSNRLNGWGHEDDFAAGHALGSRKMVDAAVEGASDERARELVDQNKLAEADYANSLKAGKAKRVAHFDTAVARGQVPGAAIRTGDYAFGSGGSMSRGGASFDVPMGIGQGRQAVQRPLASIPRGFDAQEPDEGTHGSGGGVVVDRRYNSYGAAGVSRTGATAKAAPSQAFDLDVRRAKRGWDY